MANIITTPNMNLPNPVPGVDPGIDYAKNNFSSFNQIDQHNHSSGQGVQIQPNGINISSDLPFNSNNATLLKSVRFSALIAPLANTAPNTACLYVSGNELYYNDTTGGNQIQITLNGTVNATSSGISSGTATAAFSAGTLVVKSSSTSFANIDMQSAILSNNGNLTNQLTLQAPILSSSYAITLPILPAQTNVMTLDTSGNMGSITYNSVLAASSNANLGGKAVQENGKNIAVSNTNATNSLAIVRVAFDASATISAGEGATCVRNTTGNFTVTLTAAFGDTPVVVASCGGAAFLAVCSPLSSSSIQVLTFVSSTAAAVDQGFNLIAMGQRA